MNLCNIFFATGYTLGGFASLCRTVNFALVGQKEKVASLTLGVEVAFLACNQHAEQKEDRSSEASEALPASLPLTPHSLIL